MLIVMYTHSIIDDALHMVVGIIPVGRFLWHADATDAECECDCIRGV